LIDASKIVKYIITNIFFFIKKKIQNSIKHIFATMQKIRKILFSIQLTGILLLLFALFIGFATFIENDFGAEAAKSIVYNARWFEIILLLLAINMASSIFKHKMYLRKKWTILMFHVAFLVIFLGSAITRYVGFEGMISIREGATSNEMVSNKTYIQVWAEDGENSFHSLKRVFATPGSVSKFGEHFRLGDKKIRVEVKEYYTNAAETIVDEPGGKTKLVSSAEQEGRNSMDAFKAKITVGDESKELVVYRGKGFVSKTAEICVNGVEVKFNYGSRIIRLPFSLRLDDFQLERYPGSNSPSSYASEVTVLDNSKNIKMTCRIFMNNVLNYRGYRFFQSSYDPDEKGTVLSVNHDVLGTVITYIGYFLMVLGMLATIFNKSSRFRLLARLSSKLHESRKTAVWLILIISSVLLSHSSLVAAGTEDAAEELPVINKEHAAKFGKLLVQDKDGRVKPLNTLASEVLRKMARKNKFKGLDPMQVFLGMMVYPEKWQTVPIIKISHPELKNFLGIKGKYASFNRFVNIHSSGGYRIMELIKRAYAKNPAMQNKFDKEVMKADERVNIFYMVYSGAFLIVFPVPGERNHKWIASAKADEYCKGDEALFVKGILPMYYDAVRNAVETGNWSSADEYLGYIIKFQQKYGKEIIPPASKINLEIFYNEFNIFKRLSVYYGLIGFILLILHFINILKPKINLKTVIRIASILIIFLFVIHTAGLTIRWYISGHAPWSDGYESLIYIGWATILSGLIFMKRSQVTLSATALLTSLILSVAGMSWMDPEITNLVPVLKSYWLIIHVAVITASYGFLALGALLGFFNLILMNLRTNKNFEQLNLNIIGLSYIIEMTLIIGLFLLTIGTFLGGVWANESWGRYWGWDPKETWALVTILVYVFVIHIRFMPGFKGNFALSLAALISYSSVLMTYFGVNYYLSGLHSYARGEPAPVPDFVYYTLIVVLFVSVMAFITERKYNTRTH